MRANEIAQRLAARAEEFCRWLYPHGKRSGRDWCVGSIAGEAGDSLKICVEGSKVGRWADFGGAQDEKGDLVGLLKRARGLDLQHACNEAMDWLGVPEDQRGKAELAHKPAPKPIETRAPSETWLRLQKRMRRGTPAELVKLAELRKLPATAGLELATRHGHLWFADVWDDDFEWPAWILTDGARRNAQARRLDGKPWSGIGGKKAKTITGCEAGWPVGIAEALAAPEIAFVEGGPDFLAAWHFIWHTERVSAVRPVAMFGVNSAIHPDALPLFKGKVVWIFAHEDDNRAGVLGALQWKKQLRTAGAAQVELFDFAPNHVKDLNELATQHGEMEAAL